MIYTNLSQSPIEAWILASFDYYIDSLQNKDVVVLPITFRDDAIFDLEQAKSLSGKPIIVLDMMEYGHAVSWKNEHVLGINDKINRGIVPNREYYTALSEWLSKQRIVCYFKREFSQQIQQMNLPFPIEPIELLAIQVPKASLKAEQWHSRVGKLFHLYGFSHIDRKRMHGALQVALSNNTVNSLEHAEHCVGQRMSFSLLQEVPHYIRYAYQRVLNVNANCVLSLALPGAGVKCFRNIESSYLSIPVISDLKMRWAYPWNESNSIILPVDSDGFLLIDKSVEIIKQKLEQKDILLDVAFKAVDNCNFYNKLDYNNNYLIPTTRKYI